MSTDVTATVYFDSENEGWAWRIVVGDHEESGGCDNPDDGVNQCAACVPEGLVPELAGWKYHDHGGGESYRWSGEILDPISDEQIEQLRTEAGAAGDLVQSALCTLALADRGLTTAEGEALASTDWTPRMDQDEARAECESVIRNAAAECDE